MLCYGLWDACDRVPRPTYARQYADGSVLPEPLIRSTASPHGPARSWLASQSSATSRVQYYQIVLRYYFMKSYPSVEDDPGREPWIRASKDSVRTLSAQRPQKKSTVGTAKRCSTTSPDTNMCISNRWRRLCGLCPCRMFSMSSESPEGDEQLSLCRRRRRL